MVVVIRPSIGQDVLREIFCWESNGAGVLDGWRAYNIIPILQRCWAHLIRDLDAFSASAFATWRLQGKDIYDEVYSLDELRIRLWCAAKARSYNKIYGMGGVMVVHKATHISRPRIYLGLKEITSKCNKIEHKMFFTVNGTIKSNQKLV